MIASLDVKYLVDDLVPLATTEALGPAQSSHNNVYQPEPIVLAASNQITTVTVTHYPMCAMRAKFTHSMELVFWVVSTNSV